VICWGVDTYGQATPPASVDGSAGVATAISAGRYSSCAIQGGSDAVLCWGDNSYGQSAPPVAVNGSSGGAEAIASGAIHVLAIAAPYPDDDGDGVPDLGDNCPTLANGDQADGDGDLVGDACDNCTARSNAREAADFLVTNPWATLTGGQRDDDHDGYGNRCDADFTATGALVGTADLTQYRASSGKSRANDACGTNGSQPCARYDLDQSGALINSADLTVYRGLSGKAAGPKCPACPLACTAGTAGGCF
jgi:hypothetical protein